MRARGTLPFYIGGFLGPFGGGIVAVLVPQLRDAFDATTAGVAASIPAYLVPFAVLQLVSGTIGERLGRRRVVRVAYIAYAALSVAAAFVPTLGAFLVVRALQGSANAFLTPLLLAGLADEVPPAKIGRAVGTFAAVQTAAVALAPLGGGVLGALDWRLAFVALAVVAAGLALLPPRDATRREQPPALRTAFTRRVGLISAASFVGYASVTGVGFLVAVLAADEFGLDSITRGVLLAGFGVAGIVLGRIAGNAVDRYGRVPVAWLASRAAPCWSRCSGSRPRPWRWRGVVSTGLGSTLVWAGINTLAVEAVPDNRAGGISVISAFRFAGNAAAPLMWLPLYHADHRLGFLGAGLFTALTAVFILPLRVPR